MCMNFGNFNSSTSSQMNISGNVSVMSCDNSGTGGKLTSVCLLYWYLILKQNGFKDANNCFDIQYTY
jgi:hypothetical protein